MSESPAKNWRDTKHFNKFLGKTGKLLVWTKIYSAPEGFEYQAPYICGIVQINGKRMSVQIVDCQEEDLTAGMKLKAVIRRLRKPDPEGIIEYGVKFKPI